MRTKARKNLLGGLHNKWLERTITSDYANPVTGIKNHNSYFYFDLQHLDSKGRFALYKSIDARAPDLLNELVLGGATTSAMKMKGIVATLDENNKMRLEFIAYDDKNTMTVLGNGTRFQGTIQEFSLNTKLKGDSDFFGGFCGFVTFKKLKKAPKEYSNLDFKITYENLYMKAYPIDDV